MDRIVSILRCIATQLRWTSVPVGSMLTLFIRLVRSFRPAALNPLPMQHPTAKRPPDCTGMSICLNGDVMEVLKDESLRSPDSFARNSMQVDHGH